MTRAFKVIDKQNRDDDSKAVAALKKQGIKFITPTGDDLALWLATAGKASEKMVTTGTLPKDAADRLDNLIAEFNKANGTKVQ